jgi:cytoskeletal protein RodZ
MNGMDRQKLTKRFTVVAVTISSIGFLGSSAVGLWNLIQAPLPIQAPPNSAQAESQANSALEILRTQPEDPNANKSLELALQFYASKGDMAKLVQILEKHQQVAPNAPNASKYRKVLAQLKTPASPSSTPSSKASSQPATSPGKPSDK